MGRHHVYRFDEFLVDPEAWGLYRDGCDVHVEPEVARIPAEGAVGPEVGLAHVDGVVARLAQQYRIDAVKLLGQENTAVEVAAVSSLVLAGED